MPVRKVGLRLFQIFGDGGAYGGGVGSLRGLDGASAIGCCPAEIAGVECHEQLALADALATLHVLAQDRCADARSDGGLGHRREDRIG